MRYNIRMKRIAIINQFEAIVYFANHQVRLYHSDGNVRHLIIMLLMPSDVNPDVTPRQYLAASSEEDTVPGVDITEVA